MSESVVVAVFPEQSVAFEAYGRLPNTDELGIESAAILQREQDGRIVVPQESDTEASASTGTGALAGMLVGVLGGPIGMLLGMSAGAVTGALVSDSDLETDDDVLTQIAGSIKPGTTALVLQTDGENPAAIDGFLAEQGEVAISRQPLADVLAELEAQQAASAAAAKAARQELREQKKSERHEKWQDRVAELKKKV